jgi:hypothetical protein
VPDVRFLTSMSGVPWPRSVPKMGNLLTVERVRDPQNGRQQHSVAWPGQGETMESARFDALVRSWQRRSRRDSLRWLAGAAIGGPLALLGLSETGARRKKKKKRRAACTASCAGKFCGDDGCGGACGVACTGGKACQSGSCVCPGNTQECNGSCIAPCAAPTVRNPVTCGCCLANTQTCGQPTDAPCCSGNCVIACTNPSSGVCQFNAQCNPGQQCINNVCAVPGS